MPNRPQPGGSRSRGGIDLGAILLALGDAYGGVESNPEFGQVGPTPSGKPLGSSDPYRAKTVFDRNRAGELNALYRTGELGKDNDIARALRQKESEIPIEVRRTKEVGAVENENKLGYDRSKAQLDIENRPKLDALDVEKARLIRGIDMLVTNGILPRVANENTYNDRVVPEILAALQSKGVADTQSNNLASAKSTQDLGILKATAEPTARKALATSEFGAKLAEGQNNEFSRIFRNQMRENDQIPLMNESKMMRERLYSVGNGNLFDDRTGKLRYETPPTAQEQIINQKLGVQPRQQTSQSQRSIQDLTADDLIIDPVTKRILGVKPRQ